MLANVRQYQFLLKAGVASGRRPCHMRDAFVCRELRLVCNGRGLARSTWSKYIFKQHGWLVKPLIFQGKKILVWESKRQCPAHTWYEAAVCSCFHINFAVLEDTLEVLQWHTTSSTSTLYVGFLNHFIHLVICKWDHISHSVPSIQKSMRSLYITLWMNKSTREQTELMQK